MELEIGSEAEKEENTRVESSFMADNSVVTDSLLRLATHAATPRTLTPRNDTEVRYGLLLSVFHSVKPRLKI